MTPKIKVHADHKITGPLFACIGTETHVNDDTSDDGTILVIVYKTYADALSRGRELLQQCRDVSVIRVDE